MTNKVKKTFKNAILSDVIFDDTNFDIKPGQRIDIFSMQFVRNLFSRQEKEQFSSLELSSSDNEEIIKEDGLNLNNELKLASSKYPMLEEVCEIEDSLALAKDKFPGQRNSLDALANRFDISGYDRTFHGALLDANILADVYMSLTGGQSKFEFDSNNTMSNSTISSKNEISGKDIDLISIEASTNDLKEHELRLADIEERNAVKTIWRKVH